MASGRRAGAGYRSSLATWGKERNSRLGSEEPRPGVGRPGARGTYTAGRATETAITPSTSALVNTHSYRPAKDRCLLIVFRRSHLFSLHLGAVIMEEWKVNYIIRSRLVVSETDNAVLSALATIASTGCPTHRVLLQKTIFMNPVDHSLLVYISFPIQPHGRTLQLTCNYSVPVTSHLLSCLFSINNHGCSDIHCTCTHCLECWSKLRVYLHVHNGQTACTRTSKAHWQKGITQRQPFVNIVAWPEQVTFGYHVNCTVQRKEIRLSLSWTAWPRRGHFLLPHNGYIWRFL